MGFSCTSLLTVLHLGKAEIVLESFTLVTDLGRRYRNKTVAERAIEIMRICHKNYIPRTILTAVSKGILKVFRLLMKNVCPLQMSTTTHNKQVCLCNSTFICLCLKQS
jgi:hypothetical protein